MKNAFKLGVLALALSSMVACKGSGSSTTSDSTKTDSTASSSTMSTDTAKKDTAGSAMKADTSKMKDTTKKM